MLRIFIGYDPNEVAAYHTLAHSIITRASEPVAIVPLKLDQLPYLNRPRDPKQSTEFAFSRFLVPFLSDYEGYSLFLDCDMLCRGDIIELYNYMFEYNYDVFVVKHDYTPKTETKFLGQKQTKYEKKNWSSVMLFDNYSFKHNLTPDYVNRASGLDLHQFKWIPDSCIGELPRDWNHLVGEYEPSQTAKLVHFTLGGPYFTGYEHCEYALEWFEELEKATYSNNEPVTV
jgi:lipopolysaccharide biosynthesis glycosyltransferase